MKNQRDWFEGARDLHEDHARRGVAWTKWFVSIGFGLVAVLLVYEGRMAWEVKNHVTTYLEHSHEHWHKWIVAAAIVAPAIAGFFKVATEQRNHEPHAYSYQLMHDIFRQADICADEIPRGGQDPKDDEAFRSVAHAAGLEALAENAEWLVEHRHRPIANNAA